MTVMQTIEQQLSAVLSEKELYTQYQSRWKYLLESYLGGDDYREGSNLTQYQLETTNDYVARMRATGLDNHCNSVIQVYNSFLFRESPEREFGTQSNSTAVLDFLQDADFDGRSLNHFMKDVATWSAVFGHCWIVLLKPNVNAQTRADELAQGVRPYASLVTPLVVLDWQYERQSNGRQALTYLKYIEDINDSQRTVKEWTPELVRTVTVDIDKRAISSDSVEVNGLGYIPAVCVYNQKSPVRGIGTGDIGDIADLQRMIYNINSEIEQSIRIDSHPSLVKTPETQAGIGAGSIIHMPDNLDPGLKPYLLNYSGAEVSAMLAVKKNLEEAIDKMANTGSIRATESRVLSGVAMEVEFQLLNARLAEKASNLELAEEQMWEIFSDYQGVVWDGHVIYPSSFNLRDAKVEMAQLATAANTATDPGVARIIDRQILDLLGVENPEKYLTNDQGLPGSYVEATTEGVPPDQNCANCKFYDGFTGGCSKWDATVNPVFWCRAWKGNVEHRIDSMEDNI